MYAGVTTRLGQVGLVVVAVAIATESAAATEAVVLVAGGLGARSRGTAGLVGWIVGGALLGAAVGFAANAFVELPLAQAGSVGLGIALGGGLGGISHLLSFEDPATVDDERMTVDMTSQSTPEPRPADLFDEHPDPVLYVTTSDGGPVVRAANAAYEGAFDLPATTVEDAPLGDVLVIDERPDDLLEAVATGRRVDETLAFETPDGSRRFRVRSVVGDTDGYLLFTPIED